MVRHLVLGFVFVLFLIGLVTSATDNARRSLLRLEVIDVDKMLQNNRIMGSYVKCFIGKGPCSPEARDFKKMIPKISATACGDCTPNQKIIVRKVFLFMHDRRPDDWKKLKEFFDPQGRNTKTLDNFLGISSA